MQRIPEPELMDDDAQALAYAQADFAEPHQHFVTLVAESFPGHDFNGVVLDLGCGPADISLRFARANSKSQVHGIDGAEAMLALGRQAIQNEGLQDRIQLWQYYLPADSLPQPQYDAVISNSLLHHLQQPETLWQCIKQYARPGAPVFVMDLMRPETKQQAQQFVALYAEGEAEVLRQDFYHSLLAAYSAEEVEQQLVIAGLSGLEVSVVSDRHLTISGYC